MSIGNKIPYERSGRGADATGSLVFDQERKRTRKDEAEPVAKTATKNPRAGKQA